MDEPLFTLRRGSLPLLVSFPHSGTRLPPEIASRLTDHARTLPDTDWHLPDLYAFLRAQDVTLLAATHSRFVVDLNRPPDGASLYPGQATTGLVPTETFAGAPLYARSAPDPAEIEDRRARYWAPYHAALAAELARLRAAHGRVRLLDAHSIRSRIPRLFAGELPAINIGTYDGRAASAALVAAVRQAAASGPFTHVVDGRFKGGHITRHYGRPEAGVDAVQIELAQSAYMDEDAPAEFDSRRAAPLAAVLARIVAALLAAAG